MTTSAVSYVRGATIVASVAAVLVGCGGKDNGRRVLSSTAGTTQSRTELTWKCEDQDAQGRPIGPTILANSNDAKDYDADWHTRSEARAIARRLHLRYTEDC